ncbi:UNVERIFIED_CONTAM: hypothetical protein Sindi_1432500 [Sesamum indicum]
MGPRRVAVTQVNVVAARVSGQDVESQRHAASPSERVENQEGGHSRLTELEEKVSSLESENTVLNSKLNECRQVIQEMAGAFGGDGFAEMRLDMKQMSIQIGLLQRAVSSTLVVAHDPCARLRILEPKAYSGAHDAKEVENFLFDMKQYFLPANGAGRGKEGVDCNHVPDWRVLRKLEHTGFVREYVKAFSALMLNIRDMLEKDKLFTFMEGLRPWARLELQCQRVTDLSTAMAAAESLADFTLETRRDRQMTPSPVQNKLGEARLFKSNSNRGGGEKPHAQSSSYGNSGRNKLQENRQGAP